MSPRPSLQLVKSTETEEPVDPADLDQVFRRFAPYVARVAGRLLNHGDIDDLVQDVFLDARRGLKGLRNAASVRHWLATVAIRKARRRLRRAFFLQRLGFGPDFDPSTVVDSRASAETFVWAANVYRILDALPADARIAWVMHRVEGESLEQVGALCGWSRATAHRRVQEAEQTFARELGDATTN